MLLETKIIEIRDRGTFLSAVATVIIPDNSAEFYPVRRAGIPVYTSYLTLTILQYNETFHDQFQADVRNQRTFGVIYRHLMKSWDSHKSGDVLDVSFILNETSTPKISERLTVGQYE